MTDVLAILVGFLIGQVIATVLFVLLLIVALKKKWLERFIDWLER